MLQRRLGLETLMEQFKGSGYTLFGVFLLGFQSKVWVILGFILIIIDIFILILYTANWRSGFLVSGFFCAKPTVVWCYAF